MNLTGFLHQLHVRGKLSRPWLPGMLYARENGPSMLARCGDDGPPGWTSEHKAVLPNWVPVLDDPATVGCLLALWREATRDPTAWVQYSDDGGRKVAMAWYYQAIEDGDDVRGRGWSGRGLTEGVALAYALASMVHRGPDALPVTRPR